MTTTTVRLNQASPTRRQAAVEIDSMPTVVDWGLLTIVGMLLMAGVVMVFSASYPFSMWGKEQPFYFVTRQLIWMTIGLVVMIVFSRIPYRFWERTSIVLMGITMLSLLAVITFGAEKYGATRTFFNGSVQPSEPAKIVIIAYISAWLASKGDRIRHVRVGLLPFGILLGVLTLLIMLQPSISTAILVVATASIMFFIAGADMRQLALMGLGAAITFWIIVQYSSYASDRMDKYLASIANPLNSTEWQVKQGTQALSRGSFWGTGIGEGQAQQINYLPLSWTDNIFAIIGEETGLVGALVLTLLFALFAYRGLRIALRAPDQYGMLLATGITTLLVLQALLNAAVIVAAVPPTGVTMPFVSYGGSSLVTTLAAVGILLSVSRVSSYQAWLPEPEFKPRASAMAAQTKLAQNRNNLANPPASPETRSIRARLSAIMGIFSYARLTFGRGDGGTRLSRTGSHRTTESSTVRSRTEPSRTRNATTSGSTSRSTSTTRASSGRASSGRSTTPRTTRSSTTSASSTTSRRSRASNNG